MRQRWQSFLVALACAGGCPAQTVLLDSFNAGSAAGSVVAGSSWVNNVTPNAGSITVGGSARNDNGWSASGLALNAAAMHFIAVTAQRDAGNQATSLFLQFEDRDLRTQVFSVSTSEFAVGVPTVVLIPIGAWTINFGSTAIASWSLGGGGLGYGSTVADFRMTFDDLSFRASAIPEPSAVAAILAGAALACAVWRRGRRG